jgi:hypothetical protein
MTKMMRNKSENCQAGNGQCGSQELGIQGSMEPPRNIVSPASIDVEQESTE